MSAARPLLQNMPTNARRVERDEVSFRSELRHGDGADASIHVVDISPLGFRARCETCPAGGPVQVKLPGVGFITARVVWALGGRIGGEFSRPIDPDIYRRVLNAAPQQASWHD